MSEFETVNRGNGGYGGIPIVSVRGEGDTREIGLLQTAYQELGEPESILFKTNGNTIGMIPDSDDPNAYSVQTTHSAGSTNSGSVSAGWLTRQIGHVANGKYKLEYDEEHELYTFEVDLDE